MTVATQNFTTGPAVLPDVGTLFYNGCTFGPLFTTSIQGNAIKDSANRTVKYMEYTLAVDGYVTMATGLTSIAPTMANLRNLLTAQGGRLTYQGRGFDLVVNAAGATIFGAAARDVAWGPVPELMEFKPLGGGLSAEIKWTVTVRVVEFTTVGKAGLLEFNCETSVSYGEDYFSSMSIRGTEEIPLTRPTQGDRTLKATVDDRRSELDSRIFAGIDLSRFKVSRRNYNISRDKRTLEFDVEVQEKPYMDLPPGCSVASGTFSVKQVGGKGLVNWVCTLRATYTVRADATRRVAWWAFLTLLRLRMNQAILGFNVGPNDNIDEALRRATNRITPVKPNTALKDTWEALVQKETPAAGVKATANNCFLFDLSFDEGLYENSKTTSFSASWQLMTHFSNILVASGLWRKVSENDSAGKNLWAFSMKDVSGSVSWLPNKLDATKDIIVDFGG